MEQLSKALDFFLHLDRYLGDWVAAYGPWIYLILFAIIFVETGLVVMPLLPGDSLLFAAGTLAAISGDKGLSVFVLIPLLILAAILGDAVNYHIGKAIGPKVFKRDYRFLKRKYLEQTQAFYDKHGGKTIIIARFVPIVRTFAPFVAGVGTMSYARFLVYNIFGAILWVTLLTLAGYYFYDIKIVKENFELVILGIIALSLLPPIIEFIRHRLRSRAAQKATN